MRWGGRRGGVEGPRGSRAEGPRLKEKVENRREGRQERESVGHWLRLGGVEGEGE